MNAYVEDLPQASLGDASSKPPRTVVLKYLKWYPADQPDNWHGAGFSLDVAGLLDSLPRLEAMAMTCENVPMGCRVGVPGQKQVFDVHTLYVSVGF